VASVPLSSNSSIDLRGLSAAAGAFSIWGLLPLYLKALERVPILQVTAHRIVWGCLFALGWLALRRELVGVRGALTNPEVRLRLIASVALITINWTTYIFGIATERVVETSLGYFINPLVNVVLGVLVLRERLNAVQWAAVALAAAGVGYLTWSAGHPPWIALTLACSFGLYGFVRKVVRVDALAGFASETLMILPVGLAYLLWCEIAGAGSMGHAGIAIDGLLVLAGPLTAVPLVMFAFGARRVPYSTVGLLQYIAPTIQLLIAVFVFREPFAGPRVIGFTFIWIALAIYAADGVWRARRVSRLTGA